MEEKKEKTRDEIIKEEIKVLEKELGVSISDSDVDSYLFKGYVEKEIDVIAKKSKVIIKTLVVRERLEVESELSKKSTENPSITNQAYEHYRSIFIMSKAMIAFNGKPIGDNKITFIESLGEVLFELLTVKYNKLTQLIALVIREDVIKKD
jgi:hypothetical protein